MRILRFREAACVLDDIAGAVQSRAVNPGVSVPGRPQTAPGGYVRSAPQPTTAQRVRAGGGSCYPLIISTFPFTSAPYEGSDPRVVAGAKASAPFF